MNTIPDEEVTRLYSLQNKKYALKKKKWAIETWEGNIKLIEAKKAKYKSWTNRLTVRDTQLKILEHKLDYCKKCLEKARKVCSQLEDEIEELEYDSD